VELLEAGPPPLDPVVEYRAEVLERAGFSSITAAALAVKPSVDLHVAVDLLKNGCDPLVAVDILL
jgi:hypothetical protein